MPKWFSRIFAKDSPTRTIIAMQRLGQPVGTPANYTAFSKEAYQKNVIAFQCVQRIAKSTASVRWVLYSKRKGGKNQEIENHPLLDLLARPNPLQGTSAFFESATAFFLISGNSYIWANAPTKGKPPLELWVDRPDRMRIIPGSRGLPAAYEYSVGGGKHKYEVDAIKGTSPILHLKTFNPLDDWYGMSPIQAASLPIDQHNEAGIWNLALLQNKGAPSGALVVGVSEKNPTGKLDTEQFNTLKEQLKENVAGSQNAGRLLLLQGGLDYKEMGFSPTDMDWINGKNTSARDICLAFSFPPLLLSIQGDSTYNNQKEARLALYEDAVLPIVDFIRDEFNRWLVPAYGDSLYLDYDRDAIDALAPKREAIWSRVKDADFLTPNEKREAVGYDHIDGGDTLLVNASQIPLNLAGEVPEEEEIDEEEAAADLEDQDEEEDEKSMERKEVESLFDAFIRQYTERYVATKVTRIYGVTRDKVMKAIRTAQQEFFDEGSNMDQLSTKIREKVKGIYDGFSSSRSMTIARTETAIAAGEGSLGAAKSLRIPGLKKEWVSSDDGRSRGTEDDDTTNHRQMDGVKVGIDEKFSVPSADGSDEMSGPCDPNAPADQIINCRCTLVYSTDDKAFNLSSDTAKRQHWQRAMKKRAAIERKMAAQVSAVFKKEATELLSALDGVHDVTIAQNVVDPVLDRMKKDMTAILRVNIAAAMREFGSEILKIGS